jgi:hypothetical protein
VATATYNTEVTIAAEEQLSAATKEHELVREHFLITVVAVASTPDAMLLLLRLFS